MAAVRRPGAAPVLLTLACALPGCRKASDEASLRKREVLEFSAQLDGTRVTLYRVAKTAVRSLPPRDELQRLVAGRSELTREQWAELLAQGPLAVHKNRVGLFVVGAQLREAAYAGALVGAAVLAAKGGGRLAGDPFDVPAFALPRTGSPFASPVAFYSECRDMLADDEDRYPTLCVSMLPGPLHRAARERREIFAKAPFERLASPAFEHLALGCAWVSFQPALALYELQRARGEELQPLEAGVLRAARTALFVQNGWSYRALDELQALEQELPRIAQGAAELDRTVNAAEAQALLLGFVHLTRYQIYLRLERKADAERELALAGEQLKGQERLKAGGLLIAAKVLLDQGKYKQAAEQVRQAADALPGDARAQAELRELAARIERELPDSDAPADLIAFAARLLFRQVYELVVSADVRSWSEGFRDKSKEQLESWERSFPTTGELKEKGRELWRRLGGG